MVMWYGILFCFSVQEQNCLILRKTYSANMNSVIQIDQDIKPNEDTAITLPQGWAMADSQSALLIHSEEIPDYEHSVVFNLPLVAKRTEQLIEILNERFDLPVPVSYIRIDDSTAFHVLLLVDRFDFLSAKMYQARILAEQFMHKDDTYDIHFQFSVLSENGLIQSLLSQGYKLMHFDDKKHVA